MPPQRQQALGAFPVTDPQHVVAGRLDQSKYSPEQLIVGIDHIQTDQIGPVILILRRRRQRFARHPHQHALHGLRRIAIGHTLQLGNQRIVMRFALDQLRLPPELRRITFTAKPPVRQFGPGLRIIRKRMHPHRTAQAVRAYNLAENNNIGKRYNVGRIRQGTTNSRSGCSLDGGLLDQTGNGR